MSPGLIRTIDHTRLREVLEDHARFLAGLRGGRRAKLTHVDLRNAGLEGADLRDADLTGACMGGALLAEARLDGAALFGADLRDADLRRASLMKADLRGACLRGANLSHARLNGADLRQALIATHTLTEGFRMLSHDRRAGELDRALEFLERQGLAHRIASISAYVACAAGAEDHAAAFLICDCCGATREVSVPSGAGLAQAAAAAGYALERTTIEGHGRCEACRAA